MKVDFAKAWLAGVTLEFGSARESFIGLPIQADGRLKLMQEPQIVSEQIADIFDAVPPHAKSFNA